MYYYVLIERENVREKEREMNAFIFIDMSTDVIDQAYDDVIKWKHFPRYWPFVRGIHRSPVNFLHKGKLRGALMFLFDLRLNKRLSNQSRR